MTGRSKNMQLISVGMKSKPAHYGSIILCDFFESPPRLSQTSTSQNIVTLM